MSDIVLKVENLSKLYRLGEVGTGTISHDLNRWWAKIRGKEDPYALVGQSNDRSRKAESDYVWSLKDINFEVRQGEVLGIIGRNGAGKSTLLKLISQITSPTTGNIKVKGRIASLLEVGTGMNPELTARENIYLNGAILGMTKKEITAKFDEIVDFSGCTMYVDTPIKRFSSGMKVRLAFAVAAFLEPEILIVDEVLAVGDAEFQKKAIGKMKEVSEDGGRTVLFVSHNMAAVQSLCSRGILISKGGIEFLSYNIESVIKKYIGNDTEYKKHINLSKYERERGKRQIEFKSIEFDKDIYFPHSSLEIKLILKQNSPENISRINISFHLVDEYNNQIIHINNDFIGKGQVEFKEDSIYGFKIKKLNIKSGNYKVWLWLQGNSEAQDLITEGITLMVESGNIYNYDKSSVISGVYQPEFDFYIS